MVTPLASGVQASWERLLGGESGISRIKDFNVSDIRCKIAGQVPNGRWAHGFKPDHWVARKEQRRLAACRTEVRENGCGRIAMWRGHGIERLS